MDRARAQLREQGVIIVPVDRERFVPVPELGGSLRYDGRKHGDGTGTEPSSTLQQFSFRKEGDRLGGAFGPYMWIHEDGIGQLEGRWLRLVYWGSGHVCLRMLKGEPRRRPRSRPPQGIGESALNVDLRSRPEPARAKPEDPLVQLCRRALGEDTPQDAGKDERGTP